MAQDPVAELLTSFREDVGRGASSRADFERLKGRYVGREKGLLPALFARLNALSKFGQPTHIGILVSRKELVQPCWYGPFRRLIRHALNVSPFMLLLSDPVDHDHCQVVNCW